MELFLAKLEKEYHTFYFCSNAFLSTHVIRRNANYKSSNFLFMGKFKTSLQKQECA